MVITNSEIKSVFVKKDLEPYTQEELKQAADLPRSGMVEAVFSAPNLEAAVQLLEALFTTKFASILPSQKLADVAIVRPEAPDTGIIVVGTTGSQHVRPEDFPSFEGDLDAVALQCDCEFICAGSDLSERFDFELLH
jgi:hypothetical protein